MVIASLMLAACSDGSSRLDGDAFDDELSTLVTNVPVRPGSFVTFGSVALRNTSGHPVTLVSATPVWSEHVTVSNIGISPYGFTSSGAVVDRRAPDAVDVRGFVVPPDPDDGRHDANDEVYGITMEVALHDGELAGLVLGLDVTYRDGMRLRTQRFPLMSMVCRWTGDPCSSTYEGVEAFYGDPLDLLEQLRD
ncbi:MAG TPA: hypothetical protein VJ804_09450 [Acidimicrobiales bacterium]|nr:hypothetical protein [Acidimicrobiales bacterium]